MNIHIKAPLSSIFLSVIVSIVIKSTHACGLYCIHAHVTIYQWLTVLVGVEEIYQYPYIELSLSFVPLPFEHLKSQKICHCCYSVIICSIILLYVYMYHYCLELLPVLYKCLILFNDRGKHHYNKNKCWVSNKCWVLCGFIIFTWYF